MEFKDKGLNSLADFGRNLNQEILDNKIDPVIGRDDEIRRTIEILSRKTKNNPVLIGEPGVGKTAIIEGLAYRIVHKDVPSNLLNKTIIELSLSSLIAGASYQGQFEERLKNIINEVKKSNGDIILFIDEIHQIVGLGKNSGSNMDVANILKPLMARGEIKIIGATTLNEYRLYIEKDQALERRFTKVLVNKPTEQEALTIMRGLKPRWEAFHGIKIHDSALIAAVKLSERYINDRNLPDKAIDLIDEAAAKIKTQINSAPLELDEIKRELQHLQTEKAALDSEKDEKSQKRLASIKDQIEQKQKQFDELNNIYLAEKKQIDQLTNIRQKIEQTTHEIEFLQSEGKYEKASKLLYSDLPALNKQKEELEIKLNSEQSKHKLIVDSLSENEVADVISRATGIPLNNLLKDEKNKLLHIKDRLLEKIIGQDEAVELIANAVIRGRAGISNPAQPIGSFLFLGSTGVGKTELAKQLAIELFDSQKALIKFDMSEYMEKHSVSKLIGAPPGYIGYENAGLLTESVKRRPYCILLFDEIEKAHPDVLNLLLQILDDGVLKDSQNNEINFKNTIIIMTSNVGAKALLENDKIKAFEALHKTFRPEMLNRINEIIFFNKLPEEVVKSIAKKLLKELEVRLSTQDYEIGFDDSIANSMVEQAYSDTFGARPLKRWITRNIENQLAVMILEEKVLKNHPYKIKYNNKKDQIELAK
ncbi:ATP-dependent Clp protease ATP-binding subunit [Ureaplasma diversum]|uniref:ATP-dependent Clp protease ATP-binding subunit n=1 Tax=Ureaplasma diversum NCTC 246 TaxID=1188241 RepID=A0A084F1I2_9BACT|nr:AAA family ATPase [Ureaplasma diversum]KEZ24074.1 ATP-dependent Clp protease ATP-binding subunit [Ureaplasma diversum NCTC 246]